MRQVGHLFTFLKITHTNINGHFIKYYEQMQQDTNQSYQHQITAEQTQNINGELSPGSQTSRDAKDCFQKCFAQYINGSMNLPQKNNSQGRQAAPIQLSSNDDSEQPSEQPNQREKKDLEKVSSQSSSSQSLSPNYSSQSKKRQLQNNRRNEQLKQQRLSSKKRADQQSLKKVLTYIKPKVGQDKLTKPVSNHYNISSNNQVYSNLKDRRPPNFDIYSKPYTWEVPSEPNKYSLQDTAPIKFGYFNQKNFNPTVSQPAWPTKSNNCTMQTNRNLKLIVSPHLQKTKPTSFSRPTMSQIPEWKDISENQRFLSRRLAKDDKIDLGVYTLQQVVTFAHNEGLIKKLLYYEFTMNYNDKKQSQFVNCLVNEQLQKWDFKNNKIVLADHRRLTSLLINVKPSAYMLTDPQSLDFQVNEFLKGIYDLQEEKYYRMMEYIDKLSNNIWWLPLKIKYFTSTLLIQPTSSHTDQNTNRSIEDQNISKQPRNRQIGKSQRKRVSFIDNNSSQDEENDTKDKFKSTIQNITKPERIIKKYEIKNIDRYKKKLPNVQKSQKKKPKLTSKYMRQSDSDSSPQVRKYQPKSILKQK